MDQKQPNFTLRVIVFKKNKILLGKNRSWYGPGNFGTPGGHIEYKESFEDCLKREASEECGIEIENIRFNAVANIDDDSKRQDKLHNINILFVADWKKGEPKVLEPEKVECWDWYDIEKLPSPLFKNVEISMEAYKTGKKYFDIGK